MSTVTGTALRSQIQLLKGEIEVLDAKLNTAFFDFDTEPEDSLEDTAELNQLLAGYYEKAKKLCELQTLQSVYNARIMVEVGSDTMSLAMAIKLKFFQDVITKRWKTAAKHQTGIDYDYRNRPQLTRNADTDSAVLVVSSEEAMRQYQASAQRVQELTQAIGFGNNKKMIV